MPSDGVDEIVEQWNRERPDVDVSGMALIGRLTRLERAIRPLLESVFRDHDLEAWEFDVLATLRRSGDPYQLTPGQLLDSMMITSGAVTNRIDRLENRGFVSRSKSESDGRQVLVTLTPAGKKVVESALVDHAANELRIVGVLDSDQQATLIELLRELQRGLQSAESTDGA